MPIKEGKDAKGCYYMWGNHGKKYYYDPYSMSSKISAKSKAQRQASAAYANGYR
jgi:hypothetical protein